MADSPVRAALLRLLRRAQRVRLANRLVAYALFAASLYLTLLIAVLVLGLSLFLFHLLFYSGLSLLPLFLILGPEQEHTLGALRRLDEHCQAETFLSTTSPAHRAFLEPRVRSLLGRRERERTFRFRLHSGNRFLAIGAAGLFAGFQLLALLTLRGLPNPSVSAILKARQAALARLEAQTRESGGESAAEQAASREGAAETGEARAEKRSAADSGTGPAEEDSGPFADTGPLLNPSLGPGEESGTEGQRGSWAAIPKSETGIGPALRGALEGGPEPAAQQGQVPAGAGEAGKAFLESPLSAYQSVAQAIQAEGGQRLAASSPAEPGERLLLRALFGDFPALPSQAPGFDPAMERIQRRYLELLDERF